MKVITKTVEITVYVADDGEEFMHKESCLFHEEKMNSIKRIKWRNKIFKDLENFVNSCDTGDCLPLCDATSVIGNFVFYQNAEDCRTTIINVKRGELAKQFVTIMISLIEEWGGQSLGQDIKVTKSPIIFDGEGHLTLFLFVNQILMSRMAYHAIG